MASQWDHIPLVERACGSLSLTNDGEDEGVGEVLIQRQLHHVPAELQQSSGLGETDENVDLVKDENSKEYVVHPKGHLQIHCSAKKKGQIFIWTTFSYDHSTQSL